MKKIKLIIILTVSFLIVALVILFFVMKPYFNEIPEKHMQEIKQLFSDFEPVKLIEKENAPGYVARYDLTVDEWNELRQRLKSFKTESAEYVSGITMMIDSIFTKEEMESIVGGYVDWYRLPSIMTNAYCKTIICEARTAKGISISVYSFIGWYKTTNIIIE